MSRRVVAALTAGGLAALAIAAASAASRSGERWVPVDFLKTVRRRYPAFARVTPLGFGAGGRFYWTASESGVVIPNQREYTDGTIQHVFVWQSGRTRDLGSLGQSDNRPIAVNASGQVAVTRMVGLFTGPIGANPKLPPSRAFLWQRGRLTSLGTLGGADSMVSAIDDRGDVVGESEPHGSDIRDQHAFLWHNGKMTDLGTLGGRFSDAAAVNDAGEVVGSSLTSSGVPHAFLWKNGKMTDLGTLGGRDSEALGINEEGLIVGVSQSARFPKGELSRGFVVQAGKMSDLGVRLNMDYYPALRLGADGTIAGTTGLPEAPRGFVWRDGKLTLLGPVDGQPADVTGTGGGGRVVGGTNTSNGVFRAHAFVWASGRVNVLPGPRLPWAPTVWIDSTGTRIFAASYRTAGLRTRMILWTLRG
jgi:probable HAF family extracellular repeat protein